MIEFAYSINEIRDTGDGNATMTVSAGPDQFRLPGDGETMSIAEAQAVGAVLELLTVEQVNRSPFAGVRGPYATARAWQLAVVQHMATSATIRGLATIAAEAGAPINDEALRPLVGAL